MCLESTAWRLREFRIHDGIDQVLPDTEVTALFADGKVWGSGGCNTFGANVKHCQGSNGSLKISDLISTKKYCGEPKGIMEQESKFYEYLLAADKFSCDGLILNVTSSVPGERMLVFEPVITTRFSQDSVTTLDNANFPIGCNVIDSWDWSAWNNKMLPKPDDFHVVGQVLVANPGIEVMLVERVPQGINPEILLLDLYTYQLPGRWQSDNDSNRASKQVRFDKVLVNSDYKSVTVFCSGETIAEIEADTVD